MPAKTRTTRQGEALLAVLSETSEFRSAQELYAALSERGQRVGLATVYRHLQALTESGALDVRTDEHGEATYRRCETTGHHHHLVCRFCGKTVEVADEQIELWASALAVKAGFHDVDHTFELRGTCADCAKSR